MDLFGFLACIDIDLVALPAVVEPPPLDYRLTTLIYCGDLHVQLAFKTYSSLPRSGLANTGQRVKNLHRYPAAAFHIKFKTWVCLSDSMVESNKGPDAFLWPFVAGRVAMDMVMNASIACARMAQIALQSANQGVAKYIELTEQEMRKGDKKESVRVE